MPRLLLVGRGSAVPIGMLIVHSLESMGAFDRRRVLLIVADPVLVVVV